MRITVEKCRLEHVQAARGPDMLWLPAVRVESRRGRFRSPAIRSGHFLIENGDANHHRLYAGHACQLQCLQNFIKGGAVADGRHTVRCYPVIEQMGCRSVDRNANQFDGFLSNGPSMRGASEKLE